MFTKLLRHKLKEQRNICLILSAAAIGVSVVGSLIFWLLINYSPQATEAEDMLLIFAAIPALGGVFLGIIGCMFAITIILFYRFYKQHFTDEGYLTFTLPVSTHQHLLSSIVNICVWTLLTGVVTFISVGIILVPALLQAEPFPKDLMSEMSGIFDVFTWDTVLLGIFSCLSSFAYQIMLPITAITLGSLFVKKHKLLASFGFGYLINMGCTIIAAIAQSLSFIGCANPTYTATQEIMDFYSGFIPSVLYLILAIGGYILCHRLIETKLNLP